MSDDRTVGLGDLEWLADAPMFIDEPQVARLYDAIVRPSYELREVIHRDGKRWSFRGQGGAEAGGKVGLPSWASFLGPKAEASAKVSVKGDIERDSDEGSSATWIAPTSAERSLEDLTLFYLARHPRRLLREHGSTGLGRTKWYSQAATNWIQESPRVLAFLSLPPGVRLIPAAAEFESGRVVELFRELRQRLLDDGHQPSKKYPKAADKTPAQLRKDRKKYWSSYDCPGLDLHAMLTIEAAAAEHGRIRWIDFRHPLTEQGDTLHLHICPATGKADTGVFAYNFARRAFKHGIRLVGTVKSEPDLNVLAIYER